MKLLPDLTRILKENGKIVCEHEKELELPEKISNLRLKKEYNYGKIVVSVFTFTEEVSE